LFLHFNFIFFKILKFIFIILQNIVLRLFNILLLDWDFFINFGIILNINFFKFLKFIILFEIYFWVIIFAISYILGGGCFNYMIVKSLSFNKTSFKLIAFFNFNFILFLILFQFISFNSPFFAIS